MVIALHIALRKYRLRAALQTFDTFSCNAVVVPHQLGHARYAQTLANACKHYLTGGIGHVNHWGGQALVKVKVKRNAVTF